MDPRSTTFDKAGRLSLYLSTRTPLYTMMMMMEALADAVLVEGNVLKLQGFNKVTSIVESE